MSTGPDTTPAVEVETDEDTGPHRRIRRVGEVGEEAAEVAGIRVGPRRRPSGEQPRLPWRLRAGGRFWLAAFLLVVAVWAVVYASDAADPIIQRLDNALIDGVVGLRSEGLTEAMEAVASLSSVWLLIALRVATFAVLVVFRRWRHLVVFVASVVALRVLVSALTLVFGRIRPPGVEILGEWQGYAHPSRPIASLAVVLGGMGFALFPRGRLRNAWWILAGLALALLGFARVYLAVDHPSDVLFAAVLGVAFAIIPFRVYCPSRLFPVVYRLRQNPAHLEIDETREREIRERVQQDLGLTVEEVRPFGQEGSGGSTPLALRVRGPKDEGGGEGEGEEGDRWLFGKLYADSHLRADRRYKLARTIMYGALEDEVSFNSVRQLVEYEDYMLRVMSDHGLPTARPYGFLELRPEREYLILTEMFRRHDEADEAEITDEVIDNGLRVVRALWDRGLAHRDIKPANVLIKDGKVRLIDVAFGQVHPSPWRQAVDLANMMLVLALGSDADRVYERAQRFFAPEAIGEAFAAARGVTMPAQLRAALREDGRGLLERFRELAPDRPPISVQRWSLRRLLLTARVVATAALVGGLVLINVLNTGAP